MGDSLGQAKERAAPAEGRSSDAGRGFRESPGARWTSLLHFLERFSKIYPSHVFSEQVTFSLACGEDVETSLRGTWHGGGAAPVGDTVFRVHGHTLFLVPRRPLPWQ